MGLFIKNGPVVQVKDGSGKIDILRNRSNTPIWDGPLLIMQSEFSASASEILAGAVKDYQRGVVLGSPHSYGKGTVQTFIEFNRFMRTSDDFGSLKLTIQKFYRINGKSTQLKGVDADIPMKGLFTYAEIGEKYKENALPWDQIPTANFSSSYSLNLQKLLNNSQKRLANDNIYQLLQESALWREKLDKEEKIALNLTKFMELMKNRKEHIKKLSKYDNQLKFTLHSDEENRTKKDTAFKQKSKSWIKNLRKDIYLKEAINVISEIK